MTQTEGVCFYMQAAIDVAEQGNDDQLMAIVTQVHGRVCDCDDKHCTRWSEIYDWLYDGDYENRQYTLAELVTDWKEYAGGDAS